MQDFKVLIEAVVKILQIKLLVFGYDISLWNVMIYSLVATFLLYMFYKMME